MERRIGRLVVVLLSVALARCSGGSAGSALPLSSNASTNTGAVGATPAVKPNPSGSPQQKGNPNASPSPGVTMSPSASPIASAAPTASASPIASAPTVTPSPLPSQVASSLSHVKFGVFAPTDGYGFYTSTGALDPTKTQHILNLGARWTRSEMVPAHIDTGYQTPGTYFFGNTDELIAFERANGIEFGAALEAGPIFVAGSTAGSRNLVNRYATASQFATFCSVVAAHVSAEGVHTYSLPGNEVNTDAYVWPEGLSAVVPYAKACYSAVKAADPSAFVYGFEINQGADPIGARDFVATALSQGCGPGTCYDGLSTHLSLAYPLAANGTPCSGATPDVQCVRDIQAATGNPSLPMMMGETGITWPGGVPDAATKALADPANLNALASVPGMRYINYFDLDQCAMYVGSYFANGCLVDVNGNQVPAWAPVHQLYLAGAR